MMEVTGLSAYREKTLATSDGLRLRYRDYGSRFSMATPVACLAGLTRNAKDFDALAQHLSPHRRVLCLDARGRGRSDYDRRYRNYDLITEVGDVLQLITREFERPCAVVGTSRGGLQAMILHGVRPNLIRGIVLNDIGPDLMEEGLIRIFGYLGRRPEPLENWDDAVEALRKTNGDQFDLSDEEWMAFARRTFRDEDGRPEMDYDPRLRDAMLEAAGPVGDYWPQFRGLGDTETLVLRGERSDLLSPETIAQMRRVKPDLTVATIKGRGHAPFLDEPDSLSAIDAFMARMDARVAA